jgi:hypothetical protein
MSEQRSRVRERQEKRRDQRESMVRRTGTEQIRPVGAPRAKRPALPSGNIRLMIAAVGAIIIIGAVLLISGLINPPEAKDSPNAIWLDSRWTYGNRSLDEMTALTSRLQTAQVGHLYLYITSMLEDATWAGQNGQPFNELDASIRQYIQQWRTAYPSAKLYAWIEVQADAPEYRLDSEQLQRVVGDLSKQAKEEWEFDGIFLDVKPVFDNNQDFSTLLQTVRRSIGLTTPLAVAVPPDLTPTDAGLELPAQIAPNTVWSREYKQRIALQADVLVVSAYNSYLQDPLEYIKWVEYQVQAFVGAMSGIDTASRLLISVPNYSSRAPAHNADIESLAGALDGVRRGKAALTEAQQPFLQGVAIFTERLLNEAEWVIYQDKWAAP